MTDFVTIQQAVRITGTSDSTIRRWLRQLPIQDVQRHVRRDGQKVVISRSFLNQSFAVDQVEVFDALPDTHQHINFQNLLSRQNDQIDRLLEDNARKDQELKDAWSVITQIKQEAVRLAYELKALQSGQAVEDKSARIQTLTAIVLLVVIIALVVWLALA
jgi:DNA-binding transcriptional MerR regulator